MTVKPKKRPRPAMPIVFADMDGVIVDFDAYKLERGLTGEQLKKTEGAYLDMAPIPGAIDALKSIEGMGFTVWLATKPPTGVPHAYSDKAAWVFKHLPFLRRRLVITHHKGMLGGPDDYLLDERPHKAFCEQFQGTLLRFVDGYHWPQALEYLRAEARRLKGRAGGEGRGVDIRTESTVNMAAVAASLSAYDRVVDHLKGCTDGACAVRRPVGMHTNGGCNCAKDKHKALRLLQAATDMRQALGLAGLMPMECSGAD